VPICIIVAGERSEAYEMPVYANDIGAILYHPILSNGLNSSGEELRDFERLQWVIKIAIKALELAPADYLAEQKPHGLATFRTGRRRWIFGHAAHAGSGASTTAHSRR
jgi:hypothetical protein